VVIGGAAVLSFYLLSARTPATPGVPNVSESVSEQQAAPSGAQPAVPSPAPAPAPAPVIEPTPTATEEPDQDSDGLSDAQEAQLGTSPVDPDTDQDGLFDAEEANTYRTNPLNPDTDGDTYLDGAEVQNGYDPNGPGKLTDIPSR
jgi:hypothetical protein